MSRRQDAERLLAVWVGREWAQGHWHLSAEDLRWLRRASTRISDGKPLTGTDRRRLDRLVTTFAVMLDRLERAGLVA